jgi:putative transcriptional regulator
MAIRHHIPDRLLMAYSAGQLPEAFALVVAAHVSVCDDCRARLGCFAAIGGAVVARSEAVPMREGSLEALMARLDAGPPPPVARPAPRPRGLFPGPLRDYVGGDLEAVRWRPVGMGMRQAILPTGREATVRLLHIPAGVPIPDHGHRGLELTMVLKGALRDAIDRFGPGDVEVAGCDLQHSPVAEPGEDCICLAATDAPLRFSGLVPRLAQRFLRI